MIKSDVIKVSGCVSEDGGDGGMGVPEGVAMTESGVGYKREPTLGDAFESNQRSSYQYSCQRACYQN